MASAADADAGDVVVPTRQQALILRLFCERGHMGWLGDVSSYRLLMHKLHGAIQDIQREAVRAAQQSEDGPLDAARGTDVLVDELQHAHKRIADLERQLQHARAAPSPGRWLASEDTEDFQHEHAIVLGLQQRLSDAQAAAADELRAAVAANAELKDRVKQLEERVLTASVNAAEMQAAHGKELAALERKLEEAAALSAEKTRLLLQAEEHIKGLHVQMEEARHAAGRRAEEAAAGRDREAMTRLTEELALLQLKFAKQQIRQGELEAKYKAQLTEAQARLTEAQQQLERKGQELWEAASSCTQLRQEMEALRRQGQKDRLEWELQLERQNRQSRPSTAAPHTTATSHPGMPSAASRLAAAAAELLKRLDSSASAGASAGDSSSGAAAADMGGWHRRAGTVLSTVQLAASRLLELCGQEHTESSQLEAVDLLLQLLEQTESLVAALHGALDSAAASELLLKAFQSQVEQLSADAHKAGMLQVHVQRLQEEKDELRRHVNEKQQELTERQDLLNTRCSEHETIARQAANLRSALREAEEQLARQEAQHRHQLEAVQEQVQAHMDTMARAHREELEAIKLQLCSFSPAARSYSASSMYSPGARPQSMPPSLGNGTSFYQRLQSEIGQQPVHAMQQQLEQLMRENEQLRELHPGNRSAESGELLQQAYTQLSKLQQKYKSLKQSYVKQTLRQHAINQCLLQQAGPADIEEDDDEFSTPEAPQRPCGSPCPSKTLVESTHLLNHSKTPQKHAGTPEHEQKKTPSPQPKGKDARSPARSRTEPPSERWQRDVQATSSRAGNLSATNRGRRPEKGSASTSGNKAGLHGRAQSSLSPLRQLRR